MTFHIIPNEVIITFILPKLNAAETGRFSWLSKRLQSIVHDSAQQEHNDISLEGKCIPIVPGTITAFLHLKLRNDIFANFDRLTTLRQLTEIIKAAKGNPLDITAYVEFAKSNITTLAPDNSNILQLIVPFDFDRKQIEAKGKTSLVNVLLNAIKEESPELIRGVLAHPNAKNILGGEFHHLRDALRQAMETRNPEVIRTVLAHPDIPGDGAYGLMDSLNEVITKELPVELVRSFLSHPNASKVKSDSSYTLIGIFESAVEDGKTAYAEAILSHPKFLTVGQAHLGTALYNAISNKNIPLAKLILEHPKAKEIPVDDDHGGLRGIVQHAFARSNDEPELLQTVLLSPNIPADGEYGLGALLYFCIANKDIPVELINCILDHPNAANISANKKKIYNGQQALRTAQKMQKPEIAKLISSKLNLPTT